MTKFFTTFLIVFILSFQLLAVPASAQGLGTLIPQPKEETMKCGDLLDDYDEAEDPVKQFREAIKEDASERGEVLGCAIKTGRIHFWMVPYFIVNFIEFLIGIAGLIAILFLVIAGYQFVIAGATDKRDAAKGTVMHALLGLVLVLVAWVVVNIIQFVLTI
ncbi:hypothetical protein ACFL3C_00405 [Patescibacteria group bacterium]